jgi:hypothetical protein
LRYLLLGWDVKNIGEQCNVSQQTVYTVELNNLMRYGSVYRKLGRARKLSKADETALFEYLMAEGWPPLASARRDGVLALAGARGFGQSVDRISCFETQQVDTKRDKRISMDRS